MLMMMGRMRYSDEWEKVIANWDGRGGRWEHEAEGKMGRWRFVFISPR